MKRNIVFSKGMIWNDQNHIFNNQVFSSWSMMWGGLATHTRAWEFFSMDSLWALDSLQSWAINSEAPYNFK